MKDKKKDNKFKQPGFFKRLTCLLIGHNFLYDGFIKERPTPTLQNYIYAETETHYKNVGLGFCPRCYSFTGIHFIEEKPAVVATAEPAPIESKKKGRSSLKVSKSFTNKKKKKK